ncbi:hypothetical protein RR46_01400 [Papilio xuthus]|uniref:Uncharacterized protein n=1 Tax=Papilio xuthus TaxID=66420 RepID=I4DL68_PAPXU|nr:uncharacterized protein LOC106116590 [Papilio xuthus]KPJ01265.1 hypothetical protein RR46_01400 [Papilio xuthus]BAM18658.1 unknown unsecreted protein [Papilio xuthus]
MAESLFDIFGDHITRQTSKNLLRQPFSNNENIGKTVSNGPYKPNEPVKKVGETKKSFLLNSGKAVQSTPVRKPLSPKAVNVGAMIYTDDNNESGIDFSYEELEFTKPSYNYDNFHKDMFDYLPLPNVEVVHHISPPSTPPPNMRRYSMELDCSYQDEFFTDDFSCGSIPDNDDLGLPELY